MIPKDAFIAASKLFLREPRRKESNRGRRHPALSPQLLRLKGAFSYELPVDERREGDKRQPCEEPHAHTVVLSEGVHLLRAHAQGNGSA